MIRYFKKYIYLCIRALPGKFLLFISQLACKNANFRYAALFLSTFIAKYPQRQKKKCLLHEGEKRFISIIIPTYNRGYSLERLLQSLTKQNLPQQYFEIIVVNNASTDATHEICTNFLTAFSNFKEVYEPVSGLLAGRNAGTRTARGDILTFCDDDIEPETTWLQAIFNIMQSRSDIMLLGGNNNGNFETPPPQFVDDLWEEDGHGIRINAYYSLIENIPCGMMAPHHGYIMGCNFTVRRKVVEAAGGFGPDCMPNIIWQGDGENRVSKIAPKMGTVWLDPTISVTHHMPTSRLNEKYIEKRTLYFDISNSYNYLRNGNFSFWQNGDDKNKNKNIYLFEACNVKEVRQWLTSTTYWENESPPLTVTSKSMKLFFRNLW